MKKKHKDISRIEQPSKRTFGWYVRVSFEGKAHCKFFSDRKNGGKPVALMAAITWRNDTRGNLGKPVSDKNVCTVARTNTGVVGVRLNETLNRYDVAWVRPNGLQCKTSVSIKMHGKEGAFKRACEIRAAKEAERLVS